MISKLRRRHRLIFPVLTISIVIVSVAGIGLQEKWELANKDLPGYSSFSSNDFTDHSKYQISWNKTGLAQLYIVEQKNTSKFYLHTSDRSSVSIGSDLLIYLSKEDSDKIESSARMIGKYQNKETNYLEIPIQSESELKSAFIILYDLSKKETISIGKILKRKDLK